MSADTSVAVVLLPQQGSGDEEATRRSIAEQEPAPVGVFSLGEDGDAGEALAAAALVAFARPGDRFLPGKLARQAAELSSRPQSPLCVSAYRLAGEHREEIVTHDPTELSAPELLVRCRVEPGAAMVRAASLRDAESVRVLALPGGEAVMCAELAAQGPAAVLDEVLVEVPLDPARHGNDPATRLRTLSTVACSAPGRREPLAGVLRRELLRRLYLEGEGSGQELDLRDLGDPSGANWAGVVEDLQWALRRQRERLEAERSTWPEGQLSDEEADTVPPLEVESTERSYQIAWMGSEIAARDATIERLTAEVYRRDAVIRRLEGQVAQRAEGVP